MVTLYADTKVFGTKHISELNNNLVQVFPSKQLLIRMQLNPKPNTKFCRDSLGRLYYLTDKPKGTGGGGPRTISNRPRTIPKDFDRLSRSATKDLHTLEYKEHGQIYKIRLIKDRKRKSKKVKIQLSASLSSNTKQNIREKISKYQQDQKDIPNRIKAKEAEKKLSTTESKAKRKLDESIKRYKVRLKELPGKVQELRKKLSN